MTPDQEKMLSDLQASSSFPIDIEYALRERLGIDTTAVAITALQARTIGLNGFQTFTASGTFTVPVGYTKFLVEGVGGGAGGGWNLGGGGGGAYCRRLCDLTGVATVTVTIGSHGNGGNGGSLSAATAGGDTTFGAYFTAGGGGIGGSGGTATGGDLNVTGGNPGVAIAFSYRSTTAGDSLSAKGGDSAFGYGGNPAYGHQGDNPFPSGNVGIGYGAGGSGGSTPGGAGANGNGAAGTSGLITISW